MHWSKFDYHNPETVRAFMDETPRYQGAARVLSFLETGTPEQRETAFRIVWEDDDLVGLDESFSAKAEAYAPGCNIYAGFLIVLALRVGIDTPPIQTSIIDAIMRDDDRSFAQATSARMKKNGWSNNDIAEFNRAACAIWS